METVKNQVDQSKYHQIKIKNGKRKIRLNPISLFSSLSNNNMDEKEIQLIPLSHLFGNKFYKKTLPNNINNTDLKQSIKYNSVRKKNNTQRSVIDTIFKYNSLSQSKIPKLPKIKSYNDDRELKEGRFVSSIFNKLEDYEFKFKEQGKISDNFIKKGDKNLKLKINFFKEHQFKSKILIPKGDYKKHYSRLFRRIKFIKDT